MNTSKKKNRMMRVPSLFQSFTSFFVKRQPCLGQKRGSWLQRWCSFRDPKNDLQTEKDHAHFYRLNSALMRLFLTTGTSKHNTNILYEVQDFVHSIIVYFLTVCSKKILHILFRTAISHNLREISLLIKELKIVGNCNPCCLYQDT